MRDVLSYLRRNGLVRLADVQPHFAEFFAGLDAQLDGWTLASELLVIQYIFKSEGHWYLRIRRTNPDGRTCLQRTIRFDSLEGTREIIARLESGYFTEDPASRRTFDATTVPVGSAARSGLVLAIADFSSLSVVIEEPLPGVFDVAYLHGPVNGHTGLTICTWAESEATVEHQGRTVSYGFSDRVSCFNTFGELKNTISFVLRKHSHCPTIPVATPVPEPVRIPDETRVPQGIKARDMVEELMEAFPDFDPYPLEPFLGVFQCNYVSGRINGHRGITIYTGAGPEATPLTREAMAGVPNGGRAVSYGPGMYVAYETDRELKAAIAWCIRQHAPESVAVVPASAPTTASGGASSSTPAP